MAKETIHDITLRSTPPASHFPAVWFGRARSAVLWLAVALGGCASPDAAASGAHADRPAVGRALIGNSGCGACHVIPGVAGAQGHVGPTLEQFGRRDYIAGVLPNTPDNLVRWIVSPQSIKPGVAMPDLGITPGDAAYIAAYLYSLQ